VAEAQGQHARLRSQAAVVVARERELAARLEQVLGGLERLSDAARQALVDAAAAERRGDVAGALEAAGTAQRLARRVVEMGHRAKTLRDLHADAAEAAALAKSAVDRSAAALEATLLEREKLLTKLDTARLKEQLSRALHGLPEGSADAWRLEQAREEVEQRYARALAESELAERGLGTGGVGAGGPGAGELDLDRATTELEATAWLDRLRGELGLAASPAPPLDPPASPKPGA
jgi:phage shock protein A